MCVNVYSVYFRAATALGSLIACRHVSLCLCVSLCVSVCVCVSASVCICVCVAAWLCVYMAVCRCGYVCVCACVCVWMSTQRIFVLLLHSAAALLAGVCVCVCVCVCMCVYVTGRCLSTWLCVRACVCVCAYVCVRERVSKHRICELLLHSAHCSQLIFSYIYFISNICILFNHTYSYYF